MCKNQRNNLRKMKKQENMFQTKEEDKSLEIDLNESK